MINKKILDSVKSTWPRIEVYDLSFEKSPEKRKKFKLAWYPGMDFDIQTISNSTLEEIFKSRNFELDNIPKKAEIIPEDNQSDYYKQVKKSLIEQLETKKFAIVEWPTWTWKTTLAKTLAYEYGLELYEDWANSDKTVEEFTTDIKTETKNNILQIKTISWALEKAIKKGGVFLINEANSLSYDISLAIVNMLEAWFIIIWNKKVKVHNNFKLIFTSNKGYSWVRDYNTAVKRKAWWIINLDYEPEIDWEFKIVKNVYNKIISKFTKDIRISDDDLYKITCVVRKIREKITDDWTLLSQDLNNFGDFIYIRLYEKLILNIIYSQYANLKEELKKLIFPLLQEKIVWDNWEEFISYENSLEKLEEFISDSLNLDISSLRKIKEVWWDLDLENISQDWKNTDLWTNTGEINHYINVEKWTKAVLSWEFVDFFGSMMSKPEDTESFLEWNNFIRNWDKSIWIKKIPNPNLFRSVLENEQNSLWEELKRYADLDKIAEEINIKILESRNEKIIKNIEVIREDWVKLIKAFINWQELYFLLKDWKEITNEKWDKIELDDINEENFKQIIFWNDDFEVLLEDEFWNFYNHSNPFDNMKSLELRKFSKLIKREFEDSEIITVLWFKGEIRDIRYIWEESGKFYIPQSKVNDIITRNYKAVDKKDEYFNKKKNWQTILVLNNYNEIIVIKKSEYKEWKILIPISNKKSDLSDKLDEELRQKFWNIEELNLRNWWIEKSQTATPTSVLWKQYPIAYKLEQILDNTPTFWEEASPTTQATLDYIERTLKSSSDVLLIWPSGVWKSTYSLDIAKKMNLAYISIQVDSNTNEDDFLWENVFNEWLLEKRKSAFLDYYINWWIVELKELNMNSDMTFLNNFMDKNWTINFDGHTYRRHPDFHIIATINPFDNRIFDWVWPMNLANQARFTNIYINYIKDLNEEKELLFSYTELVNSELIESFDDEDSFKNFIYGSLENIVHPVRKKVDELKISQESWTDEVLKLLVSKIVTIDIFQKWLKRSKSKDELFNHFKEFYNFSDKEQEILGSDISNIFKILK